jgi:hypothetical protein
MQAGTDGKRPTGSEPTGNVPTRDEPAKAEDLGDNVPEDRSEGDTDLVISCDDCVMQDTDACKDCLVSFILNREPGDALVIDATEARALRMLSRAGLVPGPRHVRRVG